MEKAMITIDQAPPAAVTDDALADLAQRLRRTRPVANPWQDQPARGVPSDQLNELLRYWATEYEWRSHEERIRALPWAGYGAGAGSLRFIHQRSDNPAATAIVLLHGWPDSVLRFERVLPLLTDFHVVVPALPGFPFAPAMEKALSAKGIADLVAAAMAGLGYDRYVVSGADIGATIGEIMASDHPGRVAALHLANVAAGHAASGPDRLPPEVREYLAYLGQWRRTEAGFIAEQGSRPGTLIAGLGDSPAGLLAWIAEKLISWSAETAGRPAFTPDELLTWVSAYWFTGTIGSSFSTYVEPAPVPDRVETPTVLSVFASDIIVAPRSYAEVFLNLAAFVEHPRGGHFAAWENPSDYVADLRLAAQLPVEG
jgi:pimeloyl-ACP methyl ester carboxylesterase